MRLFIGETRKDGKTPVRCVFKASGKAIDKVLTPERLEGYKKAADEGVFKSERGARR